MPTGQDCQQCGKCCEKWGWGQKGVIEDIIPWITQDRKDILQHVGIRFDDGTRKNGRDISLEDLPHIFGIDYWVSIKGRKIRHCPFFFRAEDGKVYCKIHDAKPNVCVRFTPWNEGIRDYALNCPACRDTAP
jgi:Fe-S-cluster containining protein